MEGIESQFIFKSFFRDAMTQFDVFNGDADGICALHQLRLIRQTDSVLVTGPKRDIALLGRVSAERGDSVTVLDISMEVNRAALLALIERGARIDYFDHHVPGIVPTHDLLHAVIDTARDVCTSILVDRHLGGKHRIWAAVGAFGDSLSMAARQLAATLVLQPASIDALQALGESLNYNAYGNTEADLFVHPADLYTILHRYPDPFRFMQSESLFRTIDAGRRKDMEMARSARPAHVLSYGKIYILPDAAWSRRVRGVFSNQLAATLPGQAFAVLTPNDLGGYAVSVRAPLGAPHNAQQLCCLFPTGGGRVGAAGINHLPPDRLPDFVREFENAFKPLT